MLVEAAWTYRFPARISRQQCLRQEALPKPVAITVAAMPPPLPGPIVIERIERWP